MSLRLAASLTFRDFQIRAKDAALAGVIKAFLGPIHLSVFNVESDADAPFLQVLTRAGISLAGINKRLEPGTIQIHSHDSHALAIHQ